MLKKPNRPAPQHVLMLAAALFFAALFLLIGSKNSPLYPINDWVDVNCFMTMGRGILHGQVPYRDLYEQKGPFLYFFYALISLFCKKTYFGVYVAEVLCFACFLFFSGRIAALYLKHPALPYPVMIALGFLIPFAPAFEHGGGVEEMHLACLSWSFFLILRALKEERLLRFSESAVIGFFAAAAFWSKYTFCGFYAALVLFVPVWYFTRKGGKALLRTVLHFLAGFFLCTLPILLYFLVNGALDDLIQVYFINNLTLYTRTDGTMLSRAIGSTKLTFNRNICYNILLIPGALLLFVGCFLKRWREALLTVLAYCGLAFTTYMSSPGYIYYGLILAPFSLSGMIALLLPFDLLLRKKKPDLPARILWGGGYFVIALGLSMALALFSHNSYAMKYHYEDTPQCQFAEIIREVPDAALCNYHFLDYGFYYAAECLPINRFYCQFNIKLDEQDEEVDALVKEGAYDFIVTRNIRLPKELMEEGGYKLITEAKYPYTVPDKLYIYYLYGLK